MVRYLREKNKEVLVVDNLRTGHRESVPEDVPLYVGDVRDMSFLKRVFSNNQIDGVIHFCAHSLVAESMEDPLRYYDNNVGGAISLLSVMRDFKVPNIIFSSTAATYGEPKTVPITEDLETVPTNPYGETKLAMEKMFKWADVAYGIHYVALRYFNVAGAYKTGKIGEDHNPETHLIPLLLQVPLGKRKEAYIFGTDYPTSDGTCVRDYIHVMDIVDAHVKALDYLEKGNPSNTFNLGTGQGFSVKEIVDMTGQVTGKPLPTILKERRAGDPAVLVADNKKAKEMLGWEPKHSNIEKMIASAWLWHKNHSEGYYEQEEILCSFKWKRRQTENL
ncbi:UDP-glucose 4-epimerase GalE [endosymbiont 'TC1' of Trimyema compressum]|nr:UDP-glucose 4-epimerase GalE [endosymbiont 'TC1' of Trimyema compressum]